MAEAETETLVTQPPSQPFEWASEFNDLSFPSMDSLFDDNVLNPSGPDLEFGLDECGDMEIVLDDLDLYFPADNEQFVIPRGDGSLPSRSNQAWDTHGTDHGLNSNSSCSVSLSPESGSSAVSGDENMDVARFLNFPPHPESSGSKREYSPQQSTGSVIHSADGSAKDSKVSEVGGCNRESSDGSVSSQGSGNCGSVVYEAMHAASPECDRDVSSTMCVNHNVKMENEKNSALKRKKEHAEENTNSSELRTSKYRRSSMIMEIDDQQGEDSGRNDEEEKRKARLMRNRESAQLSRQRKKHYVEELEDKVRSMHSTIADLNSKMSFIMAENATLKQQIGGAGMCPQPTPGMYPHPPMAPMGYPWMPYAPYVMKTQGSQVPLVPIPRLKSQQPVSASRTKKSDSRKTESKTKRVASISFLGLLFFVMLFGGLVPIVNLKFGGFWNEVNDRSTYIRDRFNSQNRGRVLHVNGNMNGSEGVNGVGWYNRNFDVPDRISYHRDHIKGEEPGYNKKQPGSWFVPGTEESDHLVNESEPLVASLYVPRNDKLVKIDGNLIIHSVLASERTMASHSLNEKKDYGESGLATSGDHASALAIPEVRRNSGNHPNIHRSTAEHLKALAANSAESLKDQFKTSASDGTMQQWFHEGLAGSLLSSGVCTEVLQFDVSPTPGIIVPAAAVANATAVNPQNASKATRSRNRRILRGLPVSVPGSGLNITEENIRRNAQEDKYSGNKSVSSMVVSVLVDPREVGETEVDGMIRKKSLSRIFVVVLIDSVKYVTYSCMLPRPAPHLVTT